MQSVSTLQVLVHAFDAHANGVQSWVVTLQLPPLHAPARLSIAVSLHVACEQVVPSGYFWQPPLPSHLPFWLQLVGPWSVQVPFGSMLPAIIAEHVPSLPGTLQALQDGQVALPQQKLSTQFPWRHSSPIVQALPSSFLSWHIPPTPVQ
jgi:hypothetical protein